MSEKVDDHAGTMLGDCYGRTLCKECGNPTPIFDRFVRGSDGPWHGKCLPFRGSGNSAGVSSGAHPPRSEICCGCNFWQPEVVTILIDTRGRPPVPMMKDGFCRIRAPVAGGLWPTTKFDDWCGEYVARPVVSAGDEQ